MNRALIMAGGTGGHVFPALAVASVLTSKGVHVSWLGTQRGIESRLVPAAKLPIHYLFIEGVRGKGLLGLLKAPFLVTYAVLQAMNVLRKEKPEAVLGFGGFASGPGGLAAWIMRIPLLIHEQNAIAGTTNRLLSRVANKILTGFNGVFEQGNWVGNPVRKPILLLPPPRERFSNRKGPTINVLVLGGSLGAKAINTLMPKVAAKLPGSYAINIWHQTGKRHLEETLSQYVGRQVNAKVEAFIDDMAKAYAWADVVVCRAGALTVAELMTVGLGAILIPLPHAIDDHQTHNAAVLVDAGAGISVAESDLTPNMLTELLVSEFSCRESLLDMAEKAHALCKQNVAERVVELTEDMVHG